MNLIKTLSILIIAGLTLNSCKDDDTGIPQNTFTYNGQSFPISKGFFEDYGMNPGGSYDIDVFLTSANVNYDTGFGDFVGFGNMVYLDLNTTDSMNLASGTYTFSVSRNAFTLVDGNILSDFNFTNLSGPEDEIIAGTVIIDKGSAETSIEFDVTTVSGSQVMGRFKGPLTYIE